MSGVADEVQSNAVRADGQSAEGTTSGDATEGSGLREASSLLPALADLQRRMVNAVRGNAQPEAASHSTETARRQLEEGGSPAPGITLVVGRQELEQACEAVIGTVLDGLFSDGVRAAVRDESERTLSLLITATQKARPPAAVLREARQEAEQSLEHMLETAFSTSLRDDTEKAGQKVTGALLHGNLPSARKEVQRVVESLITRRTHMEHQLWDEVLRKLLAVAVNASQRKAQAKDASPGSAGQDAHAADRPQTIARSDKRAQDIWDKAYAKAAREHGEGRKAERVAYDVLKQLYEKKGDRWVKKDTAQ